MLRAPIQHNFGPHLVVMTQCVNYYTAHSDDNSICLTKNTAKRKRCFDIWNNSEKYVQGLQGFQILFFRLTHFQFNSFA